MKNETKGKSKIQIRREMRDARIKADQEQMENNDLEKVKKEIAIYESGLKNLEKGSVDWYFCQFELEKQKSKYSQLLSTIGGEENY